MLRDLIVRLLRGHRRHHIYSTCCTRCHTYVGPRRHPWLDAGNAGQNRRGI